jgi:hypothetical protein
VGGTSIAINDCNNCNAVGGNQWCWYHVIVIY